MRSSADSLSVCTDIGSVDSFEFDDAVSLAAHTKKRLRPESPNQSAPAVVRPVGLGVGRKNNINFDGMRADAF